MAFLIGTIGAIIIPGTNGDDSILGSNAHERIFGGGVLGLGDDTVRGGGGNDTVRGGVGNDVLYGDDGNDWIYGDSGNDFISGGLGKDYLDGGDGIDTVDYQFYAGNGNYNLQTGVASFGSIYNPPDTNQLSIVILPPDEKMLNFENILTGGGNDTVTGSTVANYIRTAAGNDVIRAGAGEDMIDGGLGNDLLYGDDGNDRLEGQEGDDSLYGGLGSDQLNGGAGNNVLFGGDGSDAIYGSTGKDYLSGDAGDDYIIASAGNDYINGGTGNDTIEGGTGRDIMYGGIGQDAFRFSFGESVVAAPDMIKDFAVGTDKIVLSGGSLPAHFSRANNVGFSSNLSAVINAVYADANGRQFGNQALGVNDAVLVTVGSGSAAGTYLAINDHIAGFQQANDLVINISGYSGSLPGFGNLAVASFFQADIVVE
jgi:Ca2+-binding RTX toxin-like protein